MGNAYLPAQLAFMRWKGNAFRVNLLAEHAQGVLAMNAYPVSLGFSSFKIIAYKNALMGIILMLPVLHAGNAQMNALPVHLRPSAPNA